jgi:hypothetical protein
VLFLYELKWSKLYYDLSFELILFLFISIGTFFIFGLIFSRILRKNDSHTVSYKYNKKHHIFMAVLFFMINLIEGIYSGGFPLINAGLVYKEFGIPTVHVIFFITLYFYVVRTFEKFLYTDKKEFLFFSLLNLYPFILSINRGLLVLIFLNLIFLYIS